MMRRKQRNRDLKRDRRKESNERRKRKRLNEVDIEKQTDGERWQG